MAARGGESEARRIGGERAGGVGEREAAKPRTPRRFEFGDAQRREWLCSARRDGRAERPASKTPPSTNR